MKGFWDVERWYWGFMAFLLSFFLIVMVGTRCSPKTDATDPPDGRSGMGLRIDYGTGCHYLTTRTLLGESAITPRLDADGLHVCEQPGETT